MCEKGLGPVGSVYTNEVCEGADVGSVIQGAPVGTTPNNWGRGSAMIDGMEVRFWRGVR